MMKVKELDDRWTGTVAEIKAFDVRGNPFPAAVLNLDSGPTWVLQDELGGGKAPILVEGPPREFDLASLASLPLGRRVEVQGQMLCAGAKLRTGGSVTRNPNRETGGGREHVLVIRRIEEIK